MMHWIEPWTNWAWASSVQLALFVVVIWALAFACRRCSARLRYGLWALVLIKVFVVPGLTAPWSIGNLLPAEIPAAILSPAAPTSKSTAVAIAEGTTPLATVKNAETHSGLGTTGTAPTPAPAIPFQAWLMLLWSAGAVCYLVAVAVPYLLLVRRLQKDQLVEEGPLAVQYQDLALQVDPKRTPPRLLLSQHVTSPFLVGFFRPAIVLPARYPAELTSAQLEHILLHELTHWKRHDVIVGWLQVAAQAVFWFHPLMWLANARLREERENACDEQVIARRDGAARGYADTLLQVLLVSRGRSSTMPGFLGIFERSTRLQNRLEQIMNQEVRTRRFGWWQYAAIIAAGLLFLPMGASTQAVPSSPATAPAATTAPSDTPLNEVQTAWRDWTTRQFGPEPEPSRYAQAPDAEKLEAENRYLVLLEGPEGPEVNGAINGLAALRSQRAIAPLHRIATEQREKNNRSRWMSIRALSLLDNKSIVPDLIHLSYHPNQNTRLWAQIALVRLTGQNFAYDWKAWGNWWNQQGGTPRFTADQIQWVTNLEDRKWMDTMLQQERDQEFLRKWKEPQQVAAATPTPTPQRQPAGPPAIVGTSPQIGAKDVDPATREITVTFDRDMSGGMSWTGGGPEYPKIPEGARAQWRNTRTCVLPVSLEAGKFYRVGINSTSFQNFRSASGVPAQPVSIYFTTSGASGNVAAQATKPQIVTMNPANSAKDVDPNLQAITVSFNVPMGPGFSWTGGGEHFPEIPEGQRPSWSPDKKTCTLPIKLKPGWDYRLGLNSPSHKNFTSESGVPLDPVEYRFTTRQ